MRPNIHARKVSHILLCKTAPYPLSNTHLCPQSLKSHTAVTFFLFYFFIYLVLYVAFNSQGHIAMGSLQVEETSAYWTSASNYQLSNINRPARYSNRRPHRLEARTLTATPPSPLRLYSNRVLTMSALDKLGIQIVQMALPLLQSMFNYSKHKQSVLACEHKQSIVPFGD